MRKTYRPVPRPARLRPQLTGLVAGLVAEPGPEEAELIAALRRVLFGDAATTGPTRRRLH